MLQGYRVLDLTDEKGLLCGRILGDLGADVIKIEKPGGDPARNIGPFYRDEPHPERSLFWLAYNANKRGLTLDIEKVTGRDLLHKLVTQADFLIESFHPGYLDSLGLGYATLSEINPRLVFTSISPFGQSGPYRDYKAPDIVGMALGGLMYVCGEPGRPPVRISFPQAYLHAAAEAAAASLVAHYHRESTGEGQPVDVSMQECMVWTLLNVQQYWDLNQCNVERAGALRHRPASGTYQRNNWPCKDGYITFMVMGGLMGASYMRALIDWMESEGLGDPVLREVDWDTFDYAHLSQDVLDRTAAPIIRFLMTHTKQEIYAGAVKRGIQICPVQSVGDIMQDVQLQARDYFVSVFHPELGTTLLYPGPFVKASAAPLSLRRRAPLIGEHNREIYQGELGLSSSDMVLLKESGVI